MLATQFGDFSGKGSVFKERWSRFLGQGIFNADGETWSHARTLMRPQFLKERVSDTENFEGKMQSVFKLIKSGEVIDVMDIWFGYTLDVATEHLFGHCSNSLAPEGEEFATVFAEVQKLQSNMDRRGPAWKLPFWRTEDADFEKAVQALDRYVDRYVQLALTNEIHEKDESLLADLARVNRDPVFLRDALVSSLLAGRDTTAATLSWLIKELSNDPDLYKDLRNEVTDHIGTSDTPSYAQLKNFKLLQGTINETLRMYPIVPFNIRAADRDTTLPRGGGSDGMSPVFVPAGPGVLYPALVMQRAQNIPDAGQWKPRRWVEGEKYSPAPWTYIPFNGKNPQTYTFQAIGLISVQVFQEYVSARTLPRLRSLMP